jgi:cell division protein FtsQ
MDGGGRLLRSVSEAPAAFAARPLALAALAFGGLPSAGPAMRRRHLQRQGLAPRVLKLLAGHSAGLAFAAALLLATGIYGAVRGGQFAAWIEGAGFAADAVARHLGFALADITIAGQSGLSETEILAAAEVTPDRSLLFLDAQHMRERLKAVALVREATITKLYPNRLIIDIAEREPWALWQTNGEVVVISADGTVIDTRHDGRFDSLPFVVGAGANQRVAEFLGLLEAAGELRAQIRAGTLIAERRWNLTMTSGVVVKLPETDPQAAIAELARLQRDQHIVERDVISLDLRLPGRLIARLSEEAAAERAENLGARHAKPRGGHG